MTTSRYKDIKRKLALVFLVTLDFAFVIATVVGVWKLVSHYSN
jgi:hypothetical protein